MDPIACFNELVSAFLARDWQEAQDHASDLKEWLIKGGFFSLNRRDTIGFTNIVRKVCQTHLERERMQPQS